MPYWKLFYHLVWSTQSREPLLVPEVETVVYDLLRTKAFGIGGIVHALNGDVDHVHLVVSIPPKLSVATFVGQVKAVASTRVNQTIRFARPFRWQAEYGAFSFDEKRLPPIVAYVERQKQHHARGATIAVLERADDEAGTTSQIHESRTPYTTGNTEDLWTTLEALASNPE